MRYETQQQPLKGEKRLINQIKPRRRDSLQ